MPYREPALWQVRARMSNGFVRLHLSTTNHSLRVDFFSPGPIAGIFLDEIGRARTIQAHHNWRGKSPTGSLEGTSATPIEPFSQDQTLTSLLASALFRGPNQARTDMALVWRRPTVLDPASVPTLLLYGSGTAGRGVEQPGQRPPAAGSRSGRHCWIRGRSVFLQHGWKPCIGQREGNDQGVWIDSTVLRGLVPCR